MSVSQTAFDEEGLPHMAVHGNTFALNSISEAVSVIDRDGRYLLVNDAWCAMTGIPREAALGRDSRALLAVTGYMSEPRRQALQTCLHEQRVVKVTSTHSGGEDGGLRHLETTFTPYRDRSAEVHSAVLTTRDVTREVRDREAIAMGSELLRHTLNATGDAIFASDAAEPTQPVRFVNEQMLRMWGLTTHEPATLTPAHIMAAAAALFADPEGEAHEVARIVAGNLPDERRVRLRDGRVLLRRCEPAFVGGKALRVWSFRDVTAEERMLAVLKASEQQQRSLLGAFPGFIAAIDEQLRYVYVNDRLAQRLGRPAEALIGLSLGEVLGPESARMAEREARTAFAGHAVKTERHYAPLPGPQGAAQSRLDLEVVHVAGPPQADGRRVCFVFGQDITERTLAQEELRAARDEAEQANRAKSRFLAQMSHELRTPLNAIAGFAQLLQSDPLRPLAPRQQGYVHEILHGAQHLLELINEVLDLGRIEAGHLGLRCEPVLLAPLALECHALMRPLAEERGVRLSPAWRGPLQGAALAVLADRMRLKQVLLNLLANAIKYNHRGGEVALEVEPVEERVEVRLEEHAAPREKDPARLRIAVRDTGPGLDEAARERLFQPFERLGAELGGVEGTGIGLALSRGLVQAMGGRIGVDSHLGSGSRFWVELPEAAPTAEDAASQAAGSASAPAPAPADVALQGASVLYVDDNPVNLVLMEAMLDLLPGLHQLSAETGAEGLRIASAERPQLVLLDIQLPGMNGFEVLAHLRADRATASTPVVAVSANAMPADIEAARRAGFDDYLTKPVDLARLHATVRRYLSQGRSSETERLAV